MAAAVHISIQHRSIVYVVTMPIVFPILHVAYGLGSLCGLLIAPVYRIFRPKV
jgi:hypothetical protein